MHRKTRSWGAQVHVPPPLTPFNNIRDKKKTLKMKKKETKSERKNEKRGENSHEI